MCGEWPGKGTFKGTVSRFTLTESESCSSSTVLLHISREYWMIYRWPSFLAAPPPPTSAGSKLNRRHAGRLRKRDKLLMGERGGGGGGAKWYNGKKACTFINHSILSADRNTSLMGFVINCKIGRKIQRNVVPIKIPVVKNVKIEIRK
jgi:hypothetical protein